MTLDTTTKQEEVSRQEYSQLDGATLDVLQGPLVVAEQLPTTEAEVAGAVSGVAYNVENQIDDAKGAVVAISNSIEGNPQATDLKNELSKNLDVEFKEFNSQVDGVIKEAALQPEIVEKSEIVQETPASMSEAENGIKEEFDKVDRDIEFIKKEQIENFKKSGITKKPETVELPEDVYNVLIAKKNVDRSTPEVTEEMLKGVEKEQENRDQKNVVDREMRERFSKAGIGAPRGVFKRDVEPGVFNEGGFSVDGANAEADKMVAKRDVRRTAEQEAREKMQVADRLEKKGGFKAGEVHVKTNYSVMETRRDRRYLAPIQGWLDRRGAEKANKNFNQISVETVKIEAEQKSNEQKTESLQAHIADLESQHERAKLDPKIGGAQAEKLLSKIEAELRRSKADLYSTTESTKELALQHEILSNQKNLQEQYRTAFAEKIQRKNDERIAPQKEELKQVDAEIGRFRAQIQKHLDFIQEIRTQAEGFRGVADPFMQEKFDDRIRDVGNKIKDIKGSKRLRELIAASMDLRTKISDTEVEAEAFFGFITDKPIKRPDVNGAEVFSSGPTITSPDVVAEEDIEDVAEEAVAEPVEDKKENPESEEDMDKLDEEVLKVLNKKIDETQGKMKKNGFVPTGLIGDKELKEYNILTQKRITTTEEYNKLTELHKKVDQAVDSYIKQKQAEIKTAREKRREEVRAEKAAKAAAKPVQTNKPPTPAPEAAKPPSPQKTIDTTPKAKIVLPPEDLPTGKGLGVEAKPEDAKKPKAVKKEPDTKNKSEKKEEKKLKGVLERGSNEAKNTRREKMEKDRQSREAQNNRKP